MDTTTTTAPATALIPAKLKPCQATNRGTLSR